MVLTIKYTEALIITKISDNITNRFIKKRYYPDLSEPIYQNAEY